MIEIVVATTNPGKLAEIERALAGPDLLISGLASYPGAPAVAEDGATFFENARKKALAIARHTGLLTLADDSGLCVDALGGAPGVRSARFAGTGATDEMNNQKLLRELGKIPGASRLARFEAVVVLADPKEAVLRADGSCEGLILDFPRGLGGFGYDPLFYYPPLKKTFSELSLEEKLSVSHRGRALCQLKEMLPGWLEGKFGP